LIGHLQVAQKIGAASATPSAASSGSLLKAPGSAGGYLLISMAAPKRTELERALSRVAPQIPKVVVQLSNCTTTIPKHEFEATVDHAMASKGLSHASSETAAWLSLVAYVRHALTEYDDLLAQGYDHESARFFVAADIDAILNSWGVQRKLTAADS